MEQRLSKGTIGLMITAAVVIDVFQIILAFIPVVGFIANKLIAAFAAFTFWLWFSTKGIKLLTNKKRAGAMAIGSIIEIFPFPIVSALPALTTSIISTIAITVVEDKMKETGLGKVVSVLKPNVRTLSRTSKRLAGRKNLENTNIVTPKRTRQETNIRVNELPKAA